MTRLEVWVAARHRLTDAGESLAALNVHSKDRRADDAPEVLAYHAAERDLARAGDELYAAGTEADIYRKGTSIAFEVSYDQVTRHQRALFKEQLFTFIYSRHTNQENVQALVKAVAEAMRSQLRKP